MSRTDILHTPEFRTALLRRYIAGAFVSLMTRIHGEAVYVEDGGRLACKVLEKMLAPGFMMECIRLSAFGVSELREVYRDIVFGAPGGELPDGFEFVTPQGGEGRP